MEKRFNGVSMLSLQEFSLRRVAVLLWNAPRNLVSLRNPQFNLSFWKLPKNWDENVSHALSKLQLPELLAKQFKQISQPIGLHLIRWKLYHEAYLKTPGEYFDVPVLAKLQWTAAGAIDYRKTAEELVHSDVFGLVERYKLACLYCLDHYIPELWKELPQENKIDFYNEEASHVRELHLSHCWPYILKGEEHKLKFRDDHSISFNEFAFLRSSSQGNKAAAEYFLKKLTLEERKNAMFSAATWALASRSSDADSCFLLNRNISDTFFYLLSEMTTKEQATIFCYRPARVFGCFFDWPWQDSFFDFSDALWSWMKSEVLEKFRPFNYYSLQDRMYSSILVSDYCVANLYQNIFMSSPTDFKKHFVEREVYLTCPILRQLIYRQDTETIKVIFSNLDAGDKLRLVSSESMLLQFHDNISIGTGDVVEELLLLAGLSNEDKVRLKEDFKKVLKRKGSEGTESETPKWRRFFEFLDETDQVKRNSNAESSIETKKLCCERK